MRRRQVLATLGMTACTGGCLAPLSGTRSSSTTTNPVGSVWRTAHGTSGRTRHVFDDEVSLDGKRPPITHYDPSVALASPPVVGGGSVFYTTGTGVVAEGSHRWEIDAPGSALAPTLHDGTLYAHVGDGLVALAARDGTELWRRDVTPPGGLGPNPAPTVVDDTLLVSTRTEIVGVDLSTRESWRGSHDGREMFRLAASDRGVVVSGIADGNAVLFGYALDGERRWRRTVSVPAVGTNQYVCCAGDDVIVLTGDGTLVVFDTLDGTRRWEADVSGGITGRPALAEGTILVPASDTRKTVRGYDLSDGDVVWEQSVPNQSHSLTVVGGSVLVPLDGVENEVQFLSLADGTPQATYHFEHELWPDYAVTHTSELVNFQRDPD